MNRPTTLPDYIQTQGPGAWRLMVWTQPGAKSDQVAGIYQGRLKIRVGSPAVDGKANKALTTFLAKRLGVKKSQVTLAQGQTNRKKTLLVQAEMEPDWSGIAPEGA